MVSKILKRDASQLINVITKSHPVIHKHIQFKTLLQHFNSHNIFTSDEMEYFRGSNTVIDKVNYLIPCLEKKDNNGIYNFVKALNEETEHSGHHAILKELYKILFPDTAV